MIKSQQLTAKIKIKNFAQLDKSQLYAILALRMRVFCVEQNCPYLDIDQQDFTATHVFMQHHKNIIAYARILTSETNKYHIQRVVTDENYRHQGLAVNIMQACIHWIQAQSKAIIEISAQSYLQDFYRNLGFESTGDYYLEDNIPHQRMQICP